jgi:hypothetical protein
VTNTNTQASTKATPKYNLPTEYAETYSTEDQQAIAAIYEWLENNPKHNKAWLARAASQSEGTLASILSGKYNASPSKQLQAMLNAIMRTNERKVLGVDERPFVETSVWLLVRVICNHAYQNRGFGVVAGLVGTGKTRSLKHYAETNAGTLLIEADPDMTATTLLSDLLDARGISHHSTTRSEKFRMLIKALKGSECLIILDEADTVQPKALEYLRRIRDKADVGVVLAGTEKLHSMIRRENTRFEQVGSRAIMQPELIRSITREDADAVLGSQFPQLEIGSPNEAEDAQAVRDMCWSICNGSMRVLAEGLIPAVKKYMSQVPLSSKMVQGVAEKVLGLKPVRRVAA